ncbi:MAG: di-heme oxidoredictase family protein [Pirellulales bacterium]
MQAHVRARLRGLSLGALVLGCCWSAEKPCTAQDPPRQDTRIERGLELFVHEWVAGDPLAGGGDGLGPVYNAVSCAVCHKLGGMGGAGPAENNVNVLSVVPPTRQIGGKRSGPLAPITARLSRAHPGLTPQNPSLVLHHFGPGAEYEELRIRLVGDEKPFNQAPAARQAVTLRAARGRIDSRPFVRRLSPVEGLSLTLSQRNTPALFGAGLIDTVVEADLEEIAADQRRRFTSVSGRIPRANQGGVGRFGWRGQTATLRDFVLGACANELGLTAPGHQQPSVPHDPDYWSYGLDLSHDQCDDLVAFVAALPAPRQVIPDDRRQAKMVEVGERYFDQIGCSDCHRRDVGAVEGIYSDLLLHDMGPPLDDPTPANPSSLSDPGTTGVVLGSYYGTQIPLLARVSDPVRREWRTPPLWGVRDSAPYMHDGRAPTLEDAIEQHGGEAKAAAVRYRKLTSGQRSRLLMFLNTLAAPELNEPSDL